MSNQSVNELKNPDGLWFLNYFKSHAKFKIKIKNIKIRNYFDL